MPSAEPTAERGDHDRQRDVRRLAKLLRDGGYTCDQSKHLVAEARRRVGLTPPKRGRGAVDRLTSDELEALPNEAYEQSGTRGLMVRTLVETGSRVGAFCRMRADDVSFANLEVRVIDKGHLRDTCWSVGCHVSGPILKGDRRNQPEAAPTRSQSRALVVPEGRLSRTAEASRVGTTLWNRPRRSALADFESL